MDISHYVGHNGITFLLSCCLQHTVVSSLTRIFLLSFIFMHFLLSPIILILFNLISPFPYVYTIVLHSQSVVSIFPNSGHSCPLGTAMLCVLGTPVIQHCTVLHAHVLVFFFEDKFYWQQLLCWHRRRNPIIILARNDGDNVFLFFIDTTL